MTNQLESLRRYVANRPLPLIPESPDRVLLVGSGKGGVGTSTVAALLAVMAAADGQDVLVVDADESHGALPLLFGVVPEHPLARLQGGDVSVSELLIHLGHGLALLPAGGGADPEHRLEPTQRRNLLRRVSSLYDRFDLVIVDAGSRLDQVLSAASAGGTRLLAVSAAERVSAAATYALVKVIDSEFAGMPIDLLFNRCRLSAANAAFEEVDRATRHFLQRGIEFAGAIPEDERLRETIEAGTPIQDVAALGTSATAACHELSASLIRQLQERDATRQSRIRDSSPAVSAPRLFHGGRT